MGIINVYLIANKIFDDSQLEIISQRVNEWEVPLYHNIPFDSEIGKADLKGISPIDFNPDSKGVQAIKNLYLKLKQLKLELFDL